MRARGVAASSSTTWLDRSRTLAATPEQTRSWQGLRTRRISSSSSPRTPIRIRASTVPALTTSPSSTVRSLPTTAVSSLESAHAALATELAPLKSRTLSSRAMRRQTERHNSSTAQGQSSFPTSRSSRTPRKTSHSTWRTCSQRTKRWSKSTKPARRAVSLTHSRLVPTVSRRATSCWLSHAAMANNLGVAESCRTTRG